VTAAAGVVRSVEDRIAARTIENNFMAVFLFSFSAYPDRPHAW
jgi:hypothetical protein